MLTEPDPRDPRLLTATVRPIGDEQFHQWTPDTLVGREADLSRLQAMIRGGAQLITVTGMAGIGKTRLVVQVARDLAAIEYRRVVLVPLADLPDAIQAISAVGSALDVRGITAVPGGDSATDAIVADLSETPTLLVLDNGEHLRDLARAIGRVLALVPELQVVVTSQRRLSLRTETEFPLAPLALPPRVRRMSKAAPAVPEPAAAVRLFVQQAQRIWPDFDLSTTTLPLVTEICRQVDGLPLAIELAAARLRILSLAQLRDRLASGLPALGGGARDLPVRQQTMRDAIAWGHELLAPGEQALFRQLAVFVDGFDLVDVEHVGVLDAGGTDGSHADVEAVIDGLTALEDASLIVADERMDGSRRFRMLGVIRQFARERLDLAGETDAALRRHATWFAGQAVRAAEDIAAGETATWLRWLDANAANLRAAEESCFTLGLETDGVRLVGSLWRYWDIRGQLGEARRAMERALPFLDPADLPTRASLMTSLGHVVSDLGQYPRADQLYTEALAIYRSLDDEGGVAGLLNILGILLRTRGQYDRARALHDESRAIRTRRGESRGIALSKMHLARVAFHLGDYRQAEDLERSAIVEMDTIPSEDLIGFAWHASGLTAFRRGRIAEARERLERSQRSFLELGDRFGVAYARQALGRLALDEADLAQAADLLGQALDLRLDVGYVWGVVDSIEAIAEVAAAVGQYEDALGLLLAAERFRVDLGAPLDAAEAARHREVMARVQRRLPGATAPDVLRRAEARTRTQAAGDALTLATTLAASLTADAIPPPGGSGAVISQPASPAVATAPSGAVTPSPTPVPTSAPTGHALTRRELEVLGLVAEGKSDREIADVLFLSRRTVSEHVRHILGKLEVPSRTAATAHALRAGLI